MPTSGGVTAMPLGSISLSRGGRGIAFDFIKRVRKQQRRQSPTGVVLISRTNGFGGENVDGRDARARTLSGRTTRDAALLKGGSISSTGRYKPTRLLQSTNAASDPQPNRTTDDAVEKGDDDLFFGYTALLCVQSLWLVSGLLGTWAFGAWPYGKDAGYYFLGFGETTALLIPQLAASVVLRSAALRSRLTGTTFKVLNLSLLASSALLFVAELFQSLSEGGIGFKTLSATLTAGISYIALRRHGWPKFKLSIGDNNLQKLAQSYLILSVCTGALIVLNSLGSGVLSYLFGKATREIILEPHHFITYAALLAIQGGILHTLQSAAVAGEKRLSSDTYKKLNFGIILSAISALMGIGWAAKMKCQVLWVFLTLGLYNIAQLIACCSGLYIGETYK